MSVIAKFWVTSVLSDVSGSTVKLNAVCRGKDNAQWSSATPSGEIVMRILNEVAAEQFKPGEELYVHFTPAPTGKEGMDG